jgi:hypothetical protein
MAVISAHPQADHLRELAAECRRLAQLGPNEMKAGFLKTAATYEEMAAKDAESSPSQKTQKQAPPVACLKLDL